MVKLNAYKKVKLTILCIVVYLLFVYNIMRLKFQLKNNALYNYLSAYKSFANKGNWFYQPSRVQTTEH